MKTPFALSLSKRSSTNTPFALRYQKARALGTAGHHPSA